MTDNIAYLAVYNAHNGEMLKIPKPIRFHTLLDLKSYLLQHFTSYIIASDDNIFLLTPFGIKLDYLIINEMTELFLYDRRLFGENADTLLLLRYLAQNEDDQYKLLLPKRFDVVETSDTKKVQSSLRLYDGWAKALLQNCHHIEDLSGRLIKHINAIFKALNIIFQFATNFTSSAEKSFNSDFNYIKLLSMKSLHKSWLTYYSSLKNFPKVQMSHVSHPIELGGYLLEQTLLSAAEYVSEHLPPITDKFNSLSNTLTSINNEKLEIDGAIEALRKKSVSKFKNYDEFKATQLKKLATLSEKVQKGIAELDKTPNRDLPAAYSRQVLVAEELHTCAASWFQYLETLHDFKGKLSTSCLKIYESIAHLQMESVRMKTESKKAMTASDEKDEVAGSVGKIKENEDYLSLTVDLPLLFGFIMIERRRQFEWHDFFSKGIVSNLSDQLTVVIENEKVFQKLWLKKFGPYVKYLNPGNTFRIQLPSIDVTLVNGDASSTREDSIFAFLGNFDVERSDITAYIDTLKQQGNENSKKFAGLIENNFKDLIVSTEGLKNLTKVATSFSSHVTTSHKLKFLNGNGVNVEQDTDLITIKDLRSRIKKLEDLLHQQQYKNLTNWPVTKSNSKAADNRQSMILKTNYSASVVPTSTTSAKATDPIHLLHRSKTLLLKSPETDQNGFSKILDASTTIDKHLDNIRLRKENQDLNNSIAQLVKERKELKASVNSLQQKMKEAEQHLFAERNNFEEKYKITQKTMEDLAIRHEGEVRALESEKHRELKEITLSSTNMRNEISDLNSRNTDLETEVARLKKLIGENADTHAQAVREARSAEDEISDLTAKLADSKIVNSELLSNMLAKEAEFASERTDLQKNISSLRQELDEKTEDYESLMDVIQSKHKKSETVVSSLNGVITQLFSDSEMFAKAVFGYFEELCYILESMGLLLVEESSQSTGNTEYRIKRVKGLRSKKGEIEEEDMAESSIASNLHSTVVQKIMDQLKWVGELKEEISRLPHTELDRESKDVYTNAPDPLEERATCLIEIFKRHFEDSDSEMSHFSLFLKAVSFKENIQLHGQEEEQFPGRGFFYNGISKRFNDVEGFAKKLTKENKAKALELARTIKYSSNKISVKNFQVGDLVLFLPTRLDGVEPDLAGITPWTAFNIDAPHYFLDSSQEEPTKEWIVSRVAEITEHQVTQENANDATENPFKLSVGLTWYLIKTS